MCICVRVYVRVTVIVYGGSNKCGGVDLTEFEHIRVHRRRRHVVWE